MYIHIYIYMYISLGRQLGGDLVQPQGVHERVDLVGRLAAPRTRFSII